MDETTKPSTEEIVEKHEEAQPPPVQGGGGGGGWGGCGIFSAFSYIQTFRKLLPLLPKRSPAICKSLADVQSALEDSNPQKKMSEKYWLKRKVKTNDKRKAFFLSIDSPSAVDPHFLLILYGSICKSRISLRSLALGSAFKGSSDFVHKHGVCPAIFPGKLLDLALLCCAHLVLENSAVSIDESKFSMVSLPATTGSVAPSILETEKLTAKGMHMLELLGKGENYGSSNLRNWSRAIGGQFLSLYVVESISGNPLSYHMNYTQELEALSNHYALLFNRRKAKLPSDQKSSYDGKLKEVQQIFDLSSEVYGSSKESGKGKEIETGIADSTDEVKNLHDSSVNKAAELAAVAPNDMIQRTARRLDTLHSEGVHRLSELCCFAATQLVMLGKSIISTANKVADQDANAEIVKMEWPEDSIERAKVILQSRISEVAGRPYLAAVRGVSVDSHEVPQKSIQEKANAYAENLRAAHITAMGKIQDGLQYLPYVVISTSMPAA
ncbi:hypothetical protein HAX54_019125 [Datura stramonium]|uniref:DUF7798 domain-containing protein n=1 Tax=Datura stramonium TaxID=4076 RepID=A0ABS8UNK6_DATST|nr:hypothetical protein [Datura stramonium]